MLEGGGKKGVVSPQEGHAVQWRACVMLGVDTRGFFTQSAVPEK